MANILFYSNTISYAGDWRKLERLILNLDTTKFKAFVFYDTNRNHPRLNYLKNLQLLNDPVPYSNEQEFRSLAIQNQIDVIYFSRSGYMEFPFTGRYAQLQIENNIFAYTDESVYLDKSIALSHTINKRRSIPCDAVIYNPIPVPDETSRFVELRNQFDIKENDIVLGRVGRPDNFSDYALDSYRKLKRWNRHDNVWFLIMGACDKAREFVERKKIKNCIFIEPTNNDSEIDQFYRSIDIFCHYRSDGETFGNAIAEAMSYGVPVVSHYSSRYNAQTEIIGDGGIVAKNKRVYRRSLKSLILDSELRRRLGENGRKRVVDNFEPAKITRQFEGFVQSWLSN